MTTIMAFNNRIVHILTSAHESMKLYGCPLLYQPAVSKKKIHIA